MIPWGSRGRRKEKQKPNRIQECESTRIPRILKQLKESLEQLMFCFSISFVAVEGHPSWIGQNVSLNTAPSLLLNRFNCNMPPVDLKSDGRIHWWMIHSPGSIHPQLFINQQLNGSCLGSWLSLCFGRISLVSTQLELINERVYVLINGYRWITDADAWCCFCWLSCCPFR